MADTKITALTELSSAAGEDLFAIVDDPAGTPISKKITMSNVLAFIVAQANTWTAEQTITPAANTEALTVSSYSLTGSAANSLLDLSGTWNTTGTPTGIKFNVTDTASNSASLLMDLQVGGTSKLKVNKSGGITGYAGGYDDPSFKLGATGPYLYASGDYVGFASHSAGASGFIGPTQWYIGSSGDLIIARDAANTLALRNSTSAQTFNLYDTYTSATDYHRVAMKTNRATLSNVTGASVTATGVIPVGAVVVGVTTKVTTGLGTGNGTTGYQVGDGTDADRWGAITGTASGTSSGNADWTATTVQAFNAASDVVITAVGGNFDGTGVIYVSVQYLIGQSD